MSNKYKIGGKVKVIGNGNPTFHYVTIGSVATVTGISKDSVNVVGISSSHGGNTFQTVSIPDISAVVDFDKPVQTVAGVPVTTISKEGRTGHEVVGYRGDRVEPSTWSLDGRYYSNQEGGHDLINVEEKPKEVVRYINYDADDCGQVHTSRKEADEYAYSNRIACKRVVIVAGEFDE